MEQNKTEEVDLGFVFNKVNAAFINLLKSLFNALQFVQAHWWKILIVGVLGAALGFYVKNNHKPLKETTLIVQNNFESSSYVYNAIEQLNNKIKQNDTVYLKELGLYPNENIILEIEIEPIVNILGLLPSNNNPYAHRSLELYLQRADFEEELLTSEVFYPEYKYHKIHIVTTSKGDNKIAENVLAHLNNNSVFNKIKETKLKDTDFRIENYNRTLKHIDDILAAYPKKLTKEELNDKEIYVSTGDNITDLALLVESKTALLSNREYQKAEIIKYNNIVTVLSNPVLVPVKELLKNKTIGFAFLFVMVYLFIFFLRNLYLKAKKITEEN